MYFWKLRGMKGKQEGEKKNKRKRKLKEITSGRKKNAIKTWTNIRSVQKFPAF